MSFEIWKQENIDKGLAVDPDGPSIGAATTSGFDTWKQQNIKMGVTPPQENYSTEMVDYAYQSYRNTMGRAGGGMGFNRKLFETSGQATEWISKGATRTPRSHWENLKESYARGQENFSLDQDYFEATSSGDKAKADKLYKQWKMNQAREALDPIGTDGSLLNKMTYGAANIMPGMIEGGKQAVSWAAGGAAAALVLGQLGPQVLFPEEIVTVPAAVVAGFKFGTTYAWYKQGTGAMRLAMREKDVSDTTAAIVSGVAGVPYALIEQMQLGHLIPGMRQAASKVIKKSMTKILAVVTKKYGTTLSWEVAEEVAQEGIQIIAEDLAVLFDGQGIDISSEALKERGYRLWNTAKQSAISMALLPIPGAAVDLHAGLKGKKLVGKFEDAGYNVKQSESMAQKIDSGMTLTEAHTATVSETIVDSHNKYGGTTISQQSGRPIGKGFPVGIGAEEVIDSQAITIEQLNEFKAKYAEELAVPGRQIGTWYDEESGQTHLDVVHIAKTQQEAIELGTAQGKLAVYNLETGETIHLAKEEKTPGILPAEQKATTQIQRDEFVNEWAMSHGITEVDAQQRLDNAEVKYRKLVEKSTKKDLSYNEQLEHDFLKKNRKDIKAILERDSGPVEGKTYSKKQVMDRVHNLSDLLGYDVVNRRALMERLTGKDSLTKMVPAQREQVMAFLEREAKEQGANIEGIDTTPVGEMMTKMRERKQKPVLTRRDRRTMSIMSRMIADIKRGFSYYFLNSSRIRRVTRALDNYEDDGPFQRYIHRAVRDADARAVSNFTSVMEATADAFREMGVDAPGMMTEVKDVMLPGKEVDRAKLKQAYVDRFNSMLQIIANSADNIAEKAGNKNFQLEAMSRELQSLNDSYDKISETIETDPVLFAELLEIKKLLPGYTKVVGAFQEKPSKAAFNKIKKISDQMKVLQKKYDNKLRGELGGIIEATILKDKLTTAERIGVYALAKNEKTRNHLLSEFNEEEIVAIEQSVMGSEEEMLVANEITAYFEHGWPEFEAIAKAVGIKGLVKEENYITAFITDKDGLDTPDFLEGLTQQFGDAKHVPGEERAIARKPGARRNLELNIFVVHARAARSIERFKVMAPVAAKVGSILNHRGFKNNLNNVTYGHGSNLFTKWLQDSVRGKAAYDNSRFAPMLRWLRTSSMNYVVGFKILLAGKQGISVLTGMTVDPGMVPLVFANIAKVANPKVYAKMYAEATKKSKLLLTRDWNRDLRATYNKAQVKKLYQGKKLSPISMRMATYIDQHTTTAVWTSAYQLARGKSMNEKESIQFADGVIQDTQPMGGAVDLPTFFRGSEFEKTLTIFQNQVNQNGNILWYDILGEKRASKINYTQAGYRVMMSQVLPALLLGMISRGRPPESAGEIAKDMFSFLMSPFVFVGRLAYNIIAGDWGPNRNIAETPFTETGRLVSAVKKGDAQKITKYAARSIGAWSGGKIPLQAVTTAEGAWNLATGETEDWRELVWSKYALKSKKSEKDKPLKVRY